jgi:hypothetical protein
MSDCEACAVCVGCGLRWCRDENVSPGEADGICRDCYETEDPEVAVA